MKVIHIQPNSLGEIKEIDGSLESMQALVGGLIEEVKISEEFSLIINEEGKLLGLPPNVLWMSCFGDIIDIIVGDCFIAYTPAGAEEFMSIPDELISKALELPLMHIA